KLAMFALRLAGRVLGFVLLAAVLVAAAPVTVVAGAGLAGAWLRGWPPSRLWRAAAPSPGLARRLPRCGGRPPPPSPRGRAVSAVVVALRRLGGGVGGASVGASTVCAACWSAGAAGLVRRRRGALALAPRGPRCAAPPFRPAPLPTSRFNPKRTRRIPRFSS